MAVFPTFNVSAKSDLFICQTGHNNVKRPFSPYKLKCTDKTPNSHLVLLLGAIFKPKNSMKAFPLVGVQVFCNHETDLHVHITCSFLKKKEKKINFQALE